MKDKPNYYSIIPANVRYDNSLTPNAKLLYAELTSLCNMNGRCNASTKYFADLYEVTRVSIQKWLKSLEDKKYIKREIIYKKGSKQIEKRYITLVNNPSKKMLTDNTNININNNNITYSNNISIKKKFIHDVMQFDYPKDMLEDFINYWTEGKKRMRWQKQITFEIKLRLLRWNKNQKKWDNPKNSMSKLDAQINEWQEAKKLL